MRRRDAVASASQRLKVERCPAVDDVVSAQSQVALSLNQLELHFTSSFCRPHQSSSSPSAVISNMMIYIGRRDARWMWLVKISTSFALDLLFVAMMKTWPTGWRTSARAYVVYLPLHTDQPEFRHSIWSIREGLPKWMPAAAPNTHWNVSSSVVLLAFVWILAAQVQGLAALWPMSTNESTSYRQCHYIHPRQAAIYANEH